MWKKFTKSLFVVFIGVIIIYSWLEAFQFVHRHAMVLTMNYIPTQVLGFTIYRHKYLVFEIMENSPPLIFLFFNLFYIYKIWRFKPKQIKYEEAFELDERKSAVMIRRLDRIYYISLFIMLGVVCIMYTLGTFLK